VSHLAVIGMGPPKQIVVFRVEKIYKKVIAQQARSLVETCWQKLVCGVVRK